MTTELYKKHRPKLFKHIIGQAAAVEALNVMISKDKVPHTLLFAGPSGCGKTSLARIMQGKLGCGDTDFTELNAADSRGVDTIRDIRQRMHLAPMNGKCRVWLIDECHQLTKDAQTAFLKMLEDTPSHVYFMLATTEPNKLLPTILSRCTVVRVAALSAKAMTELVLSVCKREQQTLGSTVLEQLVEVADGSPRRALVLLHQVIEMEDEDEQLNILQSADAKRQAIEIARTLMRPNATWKDLVPILKAVDEEPETIRRMVLGYANSVMLSAGGKVVPRAYLIVTAFRDHFYDCGKAGLAAACYEVLQ